jgi:predicted O-methyltransferase YrrM
MSNKDKYKSELNLINKYIDNEYIYDIIMNWGTVIDKKKIRLKANINVYEMIFIDRLLKCINAKNVLEIGCANGVSGMTIINRICKNINDDNDNNIGGLISVDPFQTTQWNNVGKINIDRIVKKCKNVYHEIIEDKSDEVLPKSVKAEKYFDAIFIDGSHSYRDVVIDIYISIKLIKKGGMLIIDDVLHPGVKKVINDMIYISNIKKVHLSDNLNKLVESTYNYSIYKKKQRSVSNPMTMYAYQKIK